MIKYMYSLARFIELIHSFQLRREKSPNHNTTAAATASAKAPPYEGKCVTIAA